MTKLYTNREDFFKGLEEFGPAIWGSTSEELKKDKKLVLEAVKRYPSSVYGLDDSIISMEDKDNIADFDNGEIEFSELLDKVDLSKDVLYESILGFAKDKVKGKFISICENNNIDYKDNLPTELYHAVSKKLDEYAVMMAIERNKQKKHKKQNDTTKAIKQIEKIRI